jgi:hypothetical protein
VKRLGIFWNLVTTDQEIPDKSFKKLKKFAFWISVLFTLVYVNPLQWVIALLSLAPLAVIFVMAFIPCLFFCAIGYWWSKSGDISKNGVDPDDEE